jgi:serine/threonine-protein kinase
VAAGSSTQTVLAPFTGLHFPGGVAVDSSGNVYVADTYNNRVVKLAAG